MPAVTCIARRNPDYIHVRYESLSRKATALVIAQHDLDTLSALVERLIAGIESGGYSAEDLADAKAALALLASRKHGNQDRQKAVVTQRD